MSTTRRGFFGLVAGVLAAVKLGPKAVQAQESCDGLPVVSWHDHEVLLTDAPPKCDCAQRFQRLEIAPSGIGWSGDIVRLEALEDVDAGDVRVAGWRIKKGEHDAERVALMPSPVGGGGEAPIVVSMDRLRKGEVGRFLSRGYCKVRAL